MLATMRIVVSGTHASGKSTLISDFAIAHPEYTVLSDPFDELLDDSFGGLDASLFSRQLDVAARRLTEYAAVSDLIAERGPLDFLAYLRALVELGRIGESTLALERAAAVTQRATAQIDLLVVLPLVDSDEILVGDDEDRELRLAMNDALLDCVAEPELAGPHVVEIAGSRAQRLAQLDEALRRL